MTEQLQLFPSAVPRPVTALNISLYDMSGAPLNPNFVRELISFAEDIAIREASLALSVIKE